jgi:hypothetical protein
LFINILLLLDQLNVFAKQWGEKIKSTKRTKVIELHELLLTTPLGRIPGEKNFYTRKCTISTGDFWA